MEIEIKKSIHKFLEYAKSQGVEIKISPEQTSDFMIMNERRRRIPLHKDMFINICEFLTQSEMIVFARVNKETYSYLEYLWPMLMLRYYPKSFIPLTDNNYIRLQLSLDDYYGSISRFDLRDNIHWINLEESEIVLSKLNKLIDEIKPSSVNAHTRLIVNNAEARSARADRDEALTLIPPEYLRFAEKFQWNSVEYREKYWTIKPEFDMRLRCYDTSIPESKAQSEEHFKWIIGIYHDKWRDDDIQNPEDSDYEYSYDYQDPSRMRRRIMPEWMREHILTCEHVL